VLTGGDGLRRPGWPDGKSPLIALGEGVAIGNEGRRDGGQSGDGGRAEEAASVDGSRGRHGPPLYVLLAAGASECAINPWNYPDCFCRNYELG